MFLNLLFWGFASMAVLGAFGVLFMRKTVYNVLSLVIVFIATAGTFVLAQAAFLGMVLIILYVGAVAVFFLFAVMMFGNELEDIKNLPNGSSLSGIVVGFFVALVLPVVVSLCFSSVQVLSSAGQIGRMSAKSIGTVLYTLHGLELQLAGLGLLVAIVGGVALTSPYRRVQRKKIGYDHLDNKKEYRLKKVSAPVREGLKHV